MRALIVWVLGGMAWYVGVGVTATKRSSLRLDVCRGGIGPIKKGRKVIIIQRTALTHMLAENHLAIMHFNLMQTKSIIYVLIFLNNSCKNKIMCDIETCKWLWRWYLCVLLGAKAQIMALCWYISRNLSFHIKLTCSSFSYHVHGSDNLINAEKAYLFVKVLSASAS